MVPPVVLGRQMSMSDNAPEWLDGVVLDDCDSLYRNLAALGILRSALWGESNEARLVTYNSTQNKLPPAFEFSGTLVLTANTLPRRNHAFDAVLSRVDVFELDATNEDVIELMRNLAKHGFENLTSDDCTQVVEFIGEFAATRELSLRLLEPSFRKVLYARESGIDWKDLVRSQLEQIGAKDELAKPANSKAYAMACLHQVIEDFPDSVRDQEEAWCQMTGRSRATFFRLKRALGNCDPPATEDESRGAPLSRLYLTGRWAPRNRGSQALRTL